MRREFTWTGWVAVVLLLLLAAAPMFAKPGEDEGPEKYSRDEWKSVLTLLEEYTKADAARKASIATELDELREMSKSDYQKFLGYVFKAVRAGGKQQWRSGATLNHPEFPGKFNFGKPSKNGGLIVILHGGGAKSNSDRSWSTAQGFWSGAVPRGFGVICPRVLEQTDGAWNVAKNIGYVYNILRAAKRDFDFDTNKVYVVGHSMGGGGAWGFGHLFSDEFAGFVAGAGAAPMTSKGPAPGVCENLYNSRGWVWHSIDDKQVTVRSDQVCAERMEALKKEHPKGYEFIYKEYTNNGHGFPPDGVGKPMQWVTQKQRDPYPKKVVFCPTMPWKDQLFWFKVNKVEPVTWYSKTYVAEIDGENSIKVTGIPSGFTIYLHPEMVDFSKPVKITADGKEVFNGEVKATMGTLLETAEKYYDPKMFFTAKVKIP